MEIFLIVWRLVENGGVRGLRTPTDDAGQGHEFTRAYGHLRSDFFTSGKVAPNIPR